MNIILCNGVSYMLVCIVALIAIIFLIDHLCQNKNLQFYSLLILSLSPSIVLLIISFIMFCLLNNSIFPSFNTYYPFIDKHCDFMVKVINILIYITKYCVWLFFLCRIKFFFMNTPCTLNTQTYYIHIVIYTFVVIVCIIQSAMYEKSTIKIKFVGNQNHIHAHKLCVPSSKNNEIIISFCIFITEITIYIILIYILFTKTKQIQQLIANNEAPNNMITNLKLMKRCLFCLVCGSILNCILTLIWLSYDINIIVAISCIVMILSVFSSFHIKLCKLGKNKINEDVNSISNQLERQMYIANIMKVYRSVPVRATVNSHSNVSAQNIQLMSLQIVEE